MKKIQIGNHSIGHEQPCYIVAEMSGNHDGDIRKAKQIIHAAKDAGADAVKLQTYRADTITLDCGNEDFLIPKDNPWEQHKTMFSLYELAYTPWEWHEELIQEANRLEIDIFSSPFDLTAVDFLESLQIPAYKIASPEITDIPLLKRVANTGKPVIVSNGVATLEDLYLAVKTLRENGCDQIILLKCTTAYPAPPEEINLRTIPHMAETFECVTGLSDHTTGIGIPVAAVACGAKLIEKHLVLDRSECGVDSFFSLEPGEFKQMVEEIRKVEKALGTVCYELTASARKNLRGRRSLYISKDIRQGESFTVNNIKSVRPAFGLHPKHYESILGRHAKKDLKKGERLTWEIIE
ncbi:pseudaminic acid synthase [Deltaproteobacteria bacterium TL4]